MREVLAAVEKYGSVTGAARELRIPRETLRSQVDRARGELVKPRVRVKAATADFEIAALPSEHEPVDELIERRKRAFTRLAEAKTARELIPIKVKIDGPYGILHMGDPHVDDNGCDWATLESHIDLIDKTPGLFAANVGDESNNWYGRLARLYSQQSTSAAEALRLVEWLIGRLPWLYIIGGNHDVWSGAQDPVRWFAANISALYEWHGMRLALQSPCGTEVRINARHDFAGTSQWNGAHAPAKAARMGWSRDHIYTCGHRHAAAHNTLVFDNGAHLAHAIRVGTYKVYDDFADSKGFPRENLPAAVTIINPGARQAADLVTVFWGVERAADYLRFLRGRC